MALYGVSNKNRTKIHDDRNDKELKGVGVLRSCPCKTGRNKKPKTFVGQIHVLIPYNITTNKVIKDYKMWIKGGNRITIILRIPPKGKKSI